MMRQFRLAALVSTAGLLFVSASPQAQQPPPQFPNMTFFITSVGARQGRRPRRPCRRRQALPDARQGGRRRRQDLARLPQHQALAAPRRSMRAIASARARGRTPRAWRSPRASPTCMANNKHHASNRPDRERRVDQRPRRLANQHDILTGSQPDGTAFPADKDMTCGNWTKSGEKAAPWSAITTAWACATTMPRSRGTPRTPRAAAARTALSRTGGDGLLYCFAAN